MTVKELIAELEEMDPDADVYMAVDPEGNAFDGIDDVEVDEFEGSWVVLWPDGSGGDHPDD